MDSKISIDEAIKARDNYVIDGLVNKALKVNPEISAVAEIPKNVYKTFENVQNFFTPFSQLRELNKNINTEKIEAFCETFGLSQNGNQEYFIDVKGVLVITEYIRQTGDVPQEGYFSNGTTYENWLEDFTTIKDPTDESGGYYTNSKLLAAINHDIEDHYHM